MFVGFKTLKIQDPENNINFPCAIFYPTDVSSQDVKLAPYRIFVSPDAPIKKNKSLPLIMLSHGSGGTYLAYRDLIASLVKNSFVVACPLHYGNNRDDNHLVADQKNLILRPRHIKLSLDSILKIDDFLTEQIAFIGHSMGGYTGLILAGGIGWLKQGHMLPANQEKRFKSFVLLSPAGGYFMAPKTLDKITSPLQVWIGEKDNVTPLIQSEFIRDHLPEKTFCDFHLVKNGNHFSFLSPFPEELSYLPQAKDIAGFDRVEYQKIFFTNVTNFLNNSIN